MQKKETDNQSNKQEEIKKKEMEEKHKQQMEKRPPLDSNKIREIARFIADSSYEGRYTIERHTTSLYRFGFGIVKSDNVPSMFEGKTANEAMYMAINFELAPEIKRISLGELTKLAEDQLAAIQDEQQKRKGLEEKLAAKNIEYKELKKERDELTQERESIYTIIGRVADKWKDDEVMLSFEKNLASWKKRPPTLIAFLLETVEKLMHERASRVAPPLELEDAERKEPLLTGGAIAVVNNTRLFEPIWSGMQDSVMNGKWHAFSEVDEIIRMHGNRGLTIESIRQKRGAYLRFAKDEKYHAERGGKDYLYKWKSIECVNKFRFTLVDEKAKPEKPVEKKEVLLEVKERPSRMGGILATVNKDVGIREPLWNDMLDSIMDGKWHPYSEANEIIRRHGHRPLSMGRILQIRSGYFKFAKDDEYHAARGGKDYLFEWKLRDGVNKFRFTPAGEEVRPEKPVENGLELGRTVDCISDHSIYENPRDEFVRLFCDGRWHTFSEPVEMFKKYDRYNRYTQSAFSTLRGAYMTYVRKLYQKIKKREGGMHKFKFEKKLVEAIKSQNDVKCARCGKAIPYGEKSHQIDNLFYCLDCYDVLELRKKSYRNF